MIVTPPKSTVKGFRSNGNIGIGGKSVNPLPVQFVVRRAGLHAVLRDYIGVPAPSRRAHRRRRFVPPASSRRLRWPGRAGFHADAGRSTGDHDSTTGEADARKDIGRNARKSEWAIS
jgi:hypothetical protein